MMGHDDMKAGLLQELIDKLMEMKEGGGAGPDAGGSPEAKIAMLDIKKDPEAEGEMDDKSPLAALAGADDESCESPEDMKKPLAPEDFQMMRRKQKLGM